MSMVAPYPTSAVTGDAVAEREMALLMQTVTAIRNIRGEMRLSPAQTLTATVKAAPADEPLLRTAIALVETLARARVTIDPAAARPRGDAIAFTRGKLARPDFTERAPADIVDKEREKLAEHEALHAKLVASLSWVG